MAKAVRDPVCLLAFALATFIYGWWFVDLYRLKVATLVETDARVTDASGGRRGWKLRYSFEVPGDPNVFTHQFLLVRDQPAHVSRDVWDDAKGSGKVRVLYDVDNPWRNRPVIAAPIERSLVFPIVAATFFAIGTLAMAFAIVANRRLHVLSRPLVEATGKSTD